MSLKFESAQVGIICLKDGCQFCCSLYGKCLENKNRSKYAKKATTKKGMESTYKVFTRLMPSFWPYVACLPTFQSVSKSTNIDNNVMVKDIDLGSTAQVLQMQTHQSSGHSVVGKMVSNVISTLLLPKPTINLPGAWMSSSYQETWQWQDWVIAYGAINHPTDYVLCSWWIKNPFSAQPNQRQRGLLLLGLVGSGMQRLRTWYQMSECSALWGVAKHINNIVATCTLYSRF